MFHAAREDRASGQEAEIKRYRSQLGEMERKDRAQAGVPTTFI